jgi:hypothetical protein
MTCGVKYEDRKINKLQHHISSEFAPAVLEIKLADRWQT